MVSMECLSREHGRHILAWLGGPSLVARRQVGTVWMTAGSPSTLHMGGAHFLFLAGKIHEELDSSATSASC